jgi:hypothetical protein
MKENSQLHISLGTDFLVLLKKEANKKGMCLSEYCRQKLRENFYLEKIEFMLNKLSHKNGNE